MDLKKNLIDLRRDHAEINGKWREIVLVKARFSLDDTDRIQWISTYATAYRVKKELFYNDNAGIGYQYYAIMRLLPEVYTLWKLTFDNKDIA